MVSVIKFREASVKDTAFTKRLASELLRGPGLYLPSLISAVVLSLLHNLHIPHILSKAVGFYIGVKSLIIPDLFTIK